jgi:hypothetical protein
MLVLAISSLTKQHIRLFFRRLHKSRKLKFFITIQKHMGKTVSEALNINKRNAA